MPVDSERKKPTPLKPGAEKWLYDNRRLAWRWYSTWLNDVDYRDVIEKAMPDERRAEINEARK